MGNQQESLPENAVPIPKFRGYFITEDARVFSIMRGDTARELKFPYDKSCKYRRGALLGDDGKKKSMLLHRLVALTFLQDTYEEGKEVNHIDGDKLNNHVTNLEWVTRTENLKHAYKLDLMTVRGESNPRSVLNEQTVLEVYNRLLLGEMATVVAKDVGVDPSTVQNIKEKSAWNYLLQDLPDIAINHKSEKLSTEIVEKICELFQEGESPKYVYDMFHTCVTKDQVYDIKRRRCFKDISSKYVW